METDSRKQNTLSIKFPESTRRDFLRGAAISGVGLFPLAKLEASSQKSNLVYPNRLSATDVLRQPDAVVAYSGLQEPVKLLRHSASWDLADVSAGLHLSPSGQELSIRVISPTTALTHLHLRWNLRIHCDVRCLGDAWERSYGDLEWRGVVPNRVMPWYFLTFDGHNLCGFGVKVQPAAFCFWQLDPMGISLWIDIRNGGMPLLLGQRSLDVATVVARTGDREETPFAAAQAFCRLMCTAPRLPVGPLYGSNDWYYAYGRNSPDGILRDADLVAQVAPNGGPRPYVVIDDGWQDPRRFPDMRDLARRIHSRNARPGIWVRPLRAPSGATSSLLLSNARFGAAARKSTPAWDPTIPEALERVLDSVKDPVNWGYEFVKHDFSTFDLLGQWGSAMGPLPAVDGWRFADRSLTTAEVLLRLYRSLRHAAGSNVVLLGCNTIGHLSAGIFESQRIGDDVSGTDWERTRRMGVNALGLRLPQHGTFYHADPDCVAITKAIDWHTARQWLDVVSRSGTSLFISAGTGDVGPDQLAVLRDAFRLVGLSYGHAPDWIDTTAPRQWRFEDNIGTQYDWSGSNGAFPFSV